MGTSHTLFSRMIGMSGGLMLATIIALGAGCTKQAAAPFVLPTQQEATALVHERYAADPAFAFSLKEKDAAYIVGSIRDKESGEAKLLVLRHDGKEWKEQGFEEGEDHLSCSIPKCPSEAEKTELSGKPYVFYVTESYGTQEGSVEFNLFSPAEMRVYTMSLSGQIDAINTPDPLSPDVQARPEIQAYLSGKIAASSKVSVRK